jgi:hypothetical protein
MVEFKVFVFKLGSIDGFTSSTIVVSKVTALAHELLNDTMEGRASITVTLFTSAERTEVLGSLWDNVSSEFHDNAA